MDRHTTAAERRAAGRPVWDGRVSINELIRNGDPDDASGVAAAVATRLRNSNWYRTSDEFSNLRGAVEELEDVEDADDFDAVMETIYDLADDDRIWLN